MTEARIKEILAEVSGWMTAEPIETERVLLRPFREGDFEDYREFMSQPELLRNTGMDGFADEAAAREAFGKLLSPEHPPTSFALEWKETGKVIGFFSIGIYPFVRDDASLEQKRGVSLSCALHADYRRRGVMTGVFRRAFAYLLGEHGLDFVNCGYFVFNDASRKLQEGLGMRYYMDHVFEHNGERIDTREMILFREDYEGSLSER